MWVIGKKYESDLQAGEIKCLRKIMSETKFNGIRNVKIKEVLKQ